MTRFLALLAALTLAIAGCGGGERSDTQAREALRARLAGPPPPELGRRAEVLWASARRFYEGRDHAPAWLPEGRPGERVAALQQAVREAELDGLHAVDYDATLDLPPGRSWNPLGRARLATPRIVEAEVRLTCAFLELASDLLVGRVDPAKVDPHWFGQYRLVALERVLERALEKGIGPTLKSLAPHHAQYAALRRSLARYRDIAAGGGWPTGFAGPRRGDEAALRARLAAEGDLPSGAGEGASPLRAALARFEARQGLEADGRLDPELVRALDVPVEARIRQLELNLERWRWLPESLGERYVIVNIPSFTLAAVEGGRTALAMRVVTGTLKDPTPIFSDRMTHVVFSPYWNVPPRIAREEIVPALMRDRSYLSRNDMEVVRGSRVVSPWSVDWNGGGYTIRQRPGPRNALGMVKFIFPNSFDVYLHDTPADRLFNSTERAYSHGCVRVEKPVELAEWVLRKQPQWTRERILAAMHGRQERHVALEEPLPVYLVYVTAWAEGDGRVSFRDDIYGHDGRQLRHLPPSPPPSRTAERAGSGGGGAAR